LLLSEEMLVSLLENLGIEVTGETSTDIICLCPFHMNKNTGAFNISKGEDAHPWRCWNASCHKSGNILALIEEVNSWDRIQSLLYIKRFNPKSSLGIKKKKVRSYDILSEEAIIEFLPPNPETLSYMLNRGFSQKTLADFSVGTGDGAIIIPCRDEVGRLVGFTRRLTYPSNFKYMDNNLPKRFILFNLNNAIKHDSVIVCEGPLDAMKIHQAGFPNVVATMMGTLTEFQAKLLRKSFSTVTIFTDADEAGRKLGGLIEEKIKGARIYWAKIPNGYKDAGEMPDEEIREAIESRESSITIRLKEKKK